MVHRKAHNYQLWWGIYKDWGGEAEEMRVCGYTRFQALSRFDALLVSMNMHKHAFRRQLVSLSPARWRHTEGVRGLYVGCTCLRILGTPFGRKKVARKVLPNFPNSWGFPLRGGQKNVVGCATKVLLSTTAACRFPLAPTSSILGFIRADWCGTGGLYGFRFSLDFVWCAYYSTPVCKPRTNPHKTRILRMRRHFPRFFFSIRLKTKRQITPH